MNFRQKKKVLWAFDRVYLKYINCKSGFNFLGPNDYFVYPSCIICERVFHIQMLNTVVQHENKNQLTYLFITFDTVCCFFSHKTTEIRESYHKSKYTTFGGMKSLFLPLSQNTKTRDK